MIITSSMHFKIQEKETPTSMCTTEARMGAAAYRSITLSRRYCSTVVQSSCISSYIGREDAGDQFTHSLEVLYATS